MLHIPAEIIARIRRMRQAARKAMSTSKISEIQIAHFQVINNCSLY